MNDKYASILDLPHHVSPTRPQMSRRDRAAQFAPFAALTGYDAAVRESARRTAQRLELDEGEKAALNACLQELADRLESRPAAAITYFLPDTRKSGGAYVTAAGAVRKIDLYDRVIRMEGGPDIPIDEILCIELLDDTP